HRQYPIGGLSPFDRRGACDSGWRALKVGFVGIVKERTGMNRMLIGALGLAVYVAPAWSVDYCDTEERTVQPGAPGAMGMTAPSDALVLFDGRELSQWKATKGGPAVWEVQDGALLVKKGSGDIETQRSFQDLQLHIEWRIPKSITGEGQHRGNSGVF